MIQTELGKACFLKAGKFVSANDIVEVKKDGLYPCYGGNGIRGYVSDYTHEGTFPLIGRQGALCGNVNFASGKFHATEHAVVVQPLLDIDVRWLFYKLCAMNLGQYATGAAQPGLAVSALEKLSIQIPDRFKQHKIALMMDKIDKIIAMRKKQLQKLDDLVKSRFIEMFGEPIDNSMSWPYISLAELCEDILGGGTPSKSHPEYFTGHIPWVTPKDMKQAVIHDSIDHISEDAILHSTTNLIPAQSVLMVIRSGILKHTLPVAINSVPVTINQDMKAFIPCEAITAAFLMYYFKAIESDVLSGVRSVTADNIDFKAFVKRNVIVPPKYLQEEFSAFITQTDKSKLTIQQSLDKLELMKKALMQKYFE